MSTPEIGQPGGLGNAFGTPATNLLADKLKPHPAVERPQLAPPQPEPPAAGQRTEQEQPAPPEHDEPARDSAPLTAPPAAAVEATFPVGVYLLPAVITAATKRRRTKGGDNATLAFDALDAMRSRLGDLVAARQAGPARAADSLFPARRGESSQAIAARTGRRRLWSFQATAAELTVIDGLWESTGAGSRSELISCAIEEYLIPIRRRGRAG
ncbi:hypothetical protein [Streptosporangium canum]|uniref:hypothetical protein n=1 Tax=Streptosporangium canum TaxID=324952 RepID=UPI0037A53138